jgi:hypothetical protein
LQEEEVVDKLREAVRLQEEERAEVRPQEVRLRGVRLRGVQLRGVRLRGVREQEWEMQSGMAIAMAVAVIVAGS